MKTFNQLMESLAEAWPGTKEYIAKYGKSALPKDSNIKDMGNGVRIHKGTYGSGEDRPEPKDAEPPVKRGRGRPAGSYGSYKTNPANKGKYKGIHAARKAKVKESLDIIEGLETEEEIQAFIESMDVEVFADLQLFLDESEGGDDDTDAQDCLEEAIEEATDTEVRDPKTGKLISWKHVGDNRPAKGDVTDKSGAKHTSMSRVRDMARKAIKKETNEDIEQIEEISKKTLGSYIKAASHDVATKGALTRQFANDAAAKKDANDFTGSRKSMEKADKTFEKSWKRREGMAKAVDRLTKESIDENLSVESLASFITKQNKE